MDNNYDDTQVDLVINKMPLSTYNELEKSKKLKPYELYFINDISEFDVKNMRIINVEDPVNIRDAVNVNYTKNNLIYKNNLDTELKNIFYYNQKIFSSDRSNCLSVNGCLYSRLSGNSDWVVQDINGIYKSSQLTVGYIDSGSGAGWTITTPLSVLKTSIIDKNLELFDYHTDDGTQSYIARRDCWKKTDSLIKKSEISSCLSSINDSSQLSDVIDVLLKLKNM